MRKVLIAVFVAGWACMAAQPVPNAFANDSGQASNQAPATSTGGAKRVRASRQGFDLDPKSAGASGTQSTAGSRGGERSKTVLYAPNLGLAYSQHPTFQWQAQSGNVSFRLYDPDDNEVYETDVTGKSSLMYPQDAPELKPGDTYRWTVEGKSIGMSEPPPSARFRVVSGADRQQLDAVLKKIAGNGTQPEMQRAQVFAEHGIWYDAVDDYSQLIARNPNDAKLYSARAEIYESLPQTKELAAADMAKAGR
jgi:hypothetical protein